MAKKTRYLSLKMPADVVESARIVAAINGMQIMDLVSGILRPRLAEMERELLAERSRTLDAAEADEGAEAEEPAPSPAPKRRGRPKGKVAGGGGGGGG